MIGKVETIVEADRKFHMVEMQKKLLIIRCRFAVARCLWELARRVQLPHVVAGIQDAACSDGNLKWHLLMKVSEFVYGPSGSATVTSDQ